MAFTAPVTEHGETSWAIVAQARDIARWRRVVGATVRAWGGDPAAVEVARLGVSELLSNVCKHVPDRRCLLKVRQDGQGVLVEVYDGSPQVPAVLVPGGDAEEGRGLWLLREMTGAMGYTLVPGGKGVWFTVPFTTGADAGGEADPSAEAGADARAGAAAEADPSTGAGTDVAREGR
ncbi:ATP-binding protein [Streptomyces sp. ACA25]|uniref:ATP-binding protein n=1 Tax=Streptomyces sp. ACA25 TaxID=3022596 RepID=UPI0023080F98|nr:ATP-binding protein [Streptomyces sp. ACA25]MDB1087977.1 ATP-binding protein [Streptomyces sp. ACA25]